MIEIGSSHLYYLKVDNVPRTINFLDAEDLGRAIVSCYVKGFGIDKNVGTLWLQFDPQRTAKHYQTLTKWLNAVKDVDVVIPKNSSPSEIRNLVSCDITISKMSMGDQYDTVIESAIPININKGKHTVTLSGYTSIK